MNILQRINKTGMVLLLLFCLFYLQLLIVCAEDAIEADNVMESVQTEETIEGTIEGTDDKSAEPTASVQENNTAEVLDELVELSEADVQEITAPEDESRSTDAIASDTVPESTHDSAEREKQNVKEDDTGVKAEAAAVPQISVDTPAPAKQSDVSQKSDGLQKDERAEDQKNRDEDPDEHYVIVLKGASAYDDSDGKRINGQFIEKNSLAYTEQVLSDNDDPDEFVKLTIYSTKEKGFIENLYVKREFLEAPDKMDIERSVGQQSSTPLGEYKGILLPAALYESIIIPGQSSKEESQGFDANEYDGRLINTENTDLDIAENDNHSLIPDQLGDKTVTYDEQQEQTESLPYFGMDAEEAEAVLDQMQTDDTDTMQSVSIDENEKNDESSDRVERAETDELNRAEAVSGLTDQLHMDTGDVVPEESETEIWREPAETVNNDTTEISIYEEIDIPIGEADDSGLVVELEDEDNGVSLNNAAFVEKTEIIEPEPEIEAGREEQTDSLIEEMQNAVLETEEMSYNASENGQPFSSEAVSDTNRVEEVKELVVSTDTEESTDDETEVITDEAFEETNVGIESEELGSVSEAIEEKQEETSYVEFTPCISYVGNKEPQSFRIVSDSYNDSSAELLEPTIITVNPSADGKFGSIVFSNPGEYGFGLSMENSDSAPWELIVTIGENEETKQLYIDTTRTVYVQSYDNNLTNNQKAIFDDNGFEDANVEAVTYELEARDVGDSNDQNQIEPVSAEIRVRSILQGHEYNGTDYFPVTLIKGAIYTLQPKDDAPMPDGITEGSLSIKADDLQPSAHGEGSVVCFGNIQFDTPGDYKYTIKQEIKSASGGTYSYIAQDPTNTKEVTVSVTQNADRLVATVVYPSGENELTFKNRYLAATLKVTWQVSQDEDETVLPLLRIRTNGNGSYPYRVYNRDDEILQDGHEWSNRTVKFNMSYNDHADIIALPVGLTYRLEVPGVDEKEISYDKQSVKTLTAGDADTVINTRIYRSAEFVKIDLQAMVRLYGYYKKDGFIYPPGASSFELVLSPIDGAPMADNASEEVLKYAIPGSESAYSEQQQSFSTIYIPKTELKGKSSVTYQYEITALTDTEKSIEYLFRNDPNPCIVTVTLTRIDPDNEDSEWRIAIDYLHAQDITDESRALFRHRYRPNEAMSIALEAKEVLYGYYQKEGKYAYPGESIEFTVTLKPVDGAPMPAGYEQEQTKTVTIEKTGTRSKNEETTSFDEIIFSLDHLDHMEAKDYYYTIETSLGERADIHYLSKGDSQQQLVTVHLSQTRSPVDIDGETEWFDQLTATISYANQPDITEQNAAVFRHQYIMAETIQPTAQIQLIGYAANNRYHFPSEDLNFDVILKAEGDAPMPETAVHGAMTRSIVLKANGVADSSNIRSQTIDFGKIGFKVPGIYHYTMLQVMKTDRPYINPIVESYPITVNVAEDPALGRLVVTPDWGSSELPLTFSNKYEATYMSVTKYLSGKGASVSQRFQVDLQLSYASEDREGDPVWLPLKNHLLSYEVGSYDANNVYQKKNSGTRMTNSEGIVSVTLAYKDRIRWYGLPDGIRYEIIERKQTNYYASYKVSASKTVDGKTVTIEKGRRGTIDVDEGAYLVRLTNTYSTVPITGYGSPTYYKMLIFCCVSVAVFSFILKKKTAKRD